MTWETDVPTMLPDSYRDAPRVRELMESIGEWMDTFPQAKFDDLTDLVNPRTVPLEFKQNLAELISLQLSVFSGSEEFRLRRQIEEAVNWYKLKGGYSAVDVIIYTIELRVTLWDKYTNDYLNFIRVPWFVSGIGIDPVPPGYYKSAHFDLDFSLDAFFGTAPDLFLLDQLKFDEAVLRIEEVRPANTVPHFVLDVRPQTDQQQDLPYTFPMSLISTVVTDLWVTELQEFDTGLILDDSLILDVSPSGFIAGVQKFKVGTGRANETPLSSWTDLDTPIYSGDITTTTIFVDRVVFEFEVPLSVVSSAGITEWGLFNSVFVEMYVVGVHPMIFKGSESEVRYTVTVFFSNIARP